MIITHYRYPQVHPANLMNETFSKDSQSQLVLST